MTAAPDLTRFGLELEEELGRGATGVVYRARQVEVGGRAVAVKVFDPSLAHSVESLGREIEATSSLRHPNVVAVYDGNTADEPRFLVLELADPAPPQLPLALSEATAVGVKLASALAVAHDAGIVHSDVKPENILWHNGVEPLLGDFGTARVEARTRYRDDAGFTPLWSPPWIPALPADPISDVWSLAASLIWFHWQWEPPDIQWEQISPELRDALAAAMPERPDLSGLGERHPAAEFGRRLQSCQSRRGWPMTQFPGGSHGNWTPGDRARSTIHTPGPPPAAHELPGQSSQSDPAVGQQPLASRAAPTGSPGERSPVPSPTQGTAGADDEPAATPARAETDEPLPAPDLSNRGSGRRRWRVAATLALLGLVGAFVVFARMPMGERLLGLAESSASDDGEPPGQLAGGDNAESPRADTDPAAPDATAIGDEEDQSGGSGVPGDAASPVPTANDDGSPSAAQPVELVSASDRQGDLDIYHHRADETVVPIVDRPSDDYAPSLSPDGSQVAFESNAAGSRAVYIATVGGTDPPRRISPPDSEAAEPAWSPDGRSLAWSSLAEGNWDIVVHDLDDGTERFVVTGASDDRNPAWSYDGTQLAFRSDRTGNGDIYVLDLDSQSLRQLTTSANEEDHPALSERGVVAFERRVDGDVELFTYDPGTGTETRRTIRSGYDGSPAFDGDRLLFVQRDSEGSQILIDDGGGPVVLHTSAGLTQDLQTAW